MGWVLPPKEKEKYGFGFSILSSVFKVVIFLGCSQSPVNVDAHSPCHQMLGELNTRAPGQQTLGQTFVTCHLPAPKYSPQLGWGWNNLSKIDTDKRNPTLLQFPVGNFQEAPMITKYN